jgi:TonB family protein
MKKNLIIAFAVMMLHAVAISAQSQRQTIYKPDQVEQRAMFPGGQDGMLSFMMQHMKYPKEAEKDKAQGTVVVHFVVEADGSISDAHVPDSQKVHPVLDAAAVQFVRNMPKWKPARLKGKAVRQRASHAVAYRYQ